MSARRWWSLAAALSLQCSGCRDFAECGPDIGPCPDVGASQCEQGKDNCDGSSLNGCETDLASSVAHCGACNVPCAGVCSGGSCVSYEVRVADRDPPQGNLVITNEHVFFAAERRYSSSLSLERLDRKGGTATLAESAWSTVDALAAGPSRLYVLGDDELASLPIVGGELKDEGLSPSAVATVGPFVTVASPSLGLLVRRGDVGDFVSASGIESADLVVAGTSSVATANYVPFEEGDEYGYELHHYDLESNETTSYGVVAGSLSGLAVADDELEERAIFYSIDRETSSGETQTTFYSVREGQAPLELGTLDGVTRWALVAELLPPFQYGRAIVASFETARNQGLRFIWAWDEGYMAEWFTPGRVGSLGAIGPRLFFHDEVLAALVEIDLDALLGAKLTLAAR